MYFKLFLFVGFTFAHMLSTISAIEDCVDDPVLEQECMLMRKSFGDKVCKTKLYHVQKLMAHHCRATCGLCRGTGSNRAFAPPITCRRSKHGCCWDGITPRHGRSGRNCPACVDRHNFKLCGQFIWMCSRSKPRNDYIKFNCPVTCGRCDPRRYKLQEDEVNPNIYQIFARTYVKLRKDRRYLGKRARKRKIKV